MYQYRQILVRMRQGDSDRDIGRSKTMGRKKIAKVRQIAAERGWLAPDTVLPDDQALAQALAHKQALPASCMSTLEPWRDLITPWHTAGIQGTTIHAALKRNHGYTGSYSSMQRFLNQIVVNQEPNVPLRLVFAPAEAAQVDFGAGPAITDVYTNEVFKTWFFVMTLAWSRHQYGEFVRDQTVATWLGCHRRAFEWFGGCVARVIIDNAKCAITRACIYDPQVQRAYAECAEGYAFKIDACPPEDPAKKGIVESGVKYIKKSFLPLREFRDLADANRQLQAWIMDEAGNRIHGTTREAPLKRFAEVEKALLAPLPAVPPELATWAKVKVHRDAHVQYEYNYYSVPFRLAGSTLWLKATNTMVTLYREHEAVATHVRATGKGQRRTVTDHLPPAAQAWQMQDTQWCLAQAEQIGPACHALVHAMFGDAVLIRLRAVQGVLRLKQKYGAIRLEAACSRANHYGTPGYKVVKTILEKGLDQQTLLAAFDALAATYTEGGRFCRDTQTILQ
ncbi:MAG: IS21 family transposase [Nitrosospira sp.]|nr:IS21 family transposase [Nitrosospira sp.]